MPQTLAQKAAKEKETTKSVTITEDILTPAQTKAARPARITAPGADSVAIAGTFNSWSLQPMLKDGDTWNFSLPLSPGRYEYRFIVDNEWRNDPKIQNTAPNGYGSTNSVLEFP